MREAEQLASEHSFSPGDHPVAIQLARYAGSRELEKLSQLIKRAV